MDPIEQAEQSSRLDGDEKVKQERPGTAEERKTEDLPPTANNQPADPRSQKIGPGETPIKVGWHMYPTRHKQVLYEAFMLDMHPWEVNERILAEYFERRYGESKSKPREQ